MDLTVAQRRRAGNTQHHFSFPFQRDLGWIVLKLLHLLAVTTSL